MPETSHAPALDAFVDAVLTSGGQLAQIIDHMGRAAAVAPAGAEPVDAVLRRLIAGTLAPLADRHDEATIASAAAVLEEAIDAVNGEIFLVPLDEIRRHRQAHGGPRRRNERSHRH
jgi:hypothetical protein